MISSSFCKTNFFAELLESRRLLSAPTLLGDLNQQPQIGYVADHLALRTGDQLLFNAGDVFTGPELWQANLLTGQSSLLKEINPGPAGSNPQHLTAFNGIVLMAATGSAHGQELWKTDGTLGGTVLVKDIRPGPEGSAISWFCAVGSTMYFVADDGTTGAELWKTDGTASGTVLVRDIASGAGSEPQALTDVNGKLFFTAQTSQGRELWSSQGTSATTAIVRDIFSGNTGSEPADLVSFGGKVIFSADHPSSGRELWQSDGTSAGTNILKEFTTGFESGSPQGMVVSGGKIFFTARTAVEGMELWTSNGTTAGTAIVGDLIPGANISGMEDFTPLGSGVLGVSTFGGFHLLFSDGTAAGSSVLQSSPDTLIDIIGGGATAYFTTRPQFGEYQHSLWLTNGLPAGTTLLKTFTPTSTVPFGPLIVAGATAYFSSAEHQFGAAVWKSDGTPDGTTLLVDPDPSTDGTYPKKYASLADGRTVFLAGNTFTGGDLFVTDGSPAGTQLLYSVSFSNDLSEVDWLCAVGNTVYFLDYTNHTGKALWKTDGTPQGTTLVKQFSTQFDQTEIAEFVSFNGKLYFMGYDPAHGYELWSSDGTESGTTLAVDVLPGTQSSGVRNLTVIGRLYFSGFRPDVGYELFTSDGTTVGTRLVKDINPGPVSSNPQRLIDLNGAAVFVAFHDTFGAEIWRSDGTSAGTQLVMDIAPGSPLLQPQYQQTFWTRLGDELIFRASTSAFGDEFWRTDGTEAGTRLLLDLRPGPLGSDALGWAASRGRLLVTQLSPSDTSGRTTLLRSIDPATSIPTTIATFIADHPQLGGGWMVEANGVAYAAVAAPGVGIELVETDGTAAGTAVVADLFPGPGSARPDYLFSAHGYLIYRADDGVVGPEAWVLADEHAPSATSTSFNFNAPSGPLITIEFNEDVGSSLAASDVILTNITTGQQLPVGSYTVQFDAARRVASIVVWPLAADGNYTMHVPRAGVSDFAGNMLAADVDLSFFLFAGDPNRDRSIDLDDFSTMSTHFNLAATFAQGDFNYSGQVDIGDFSILATKYNTTLPAARARGLTLASRIAGDPTSSRLVRASRAGEPWECATCYAFLASADAAYVTGQVMHPNGAEIVTPRT